MKINKEIVMIVVVLVVVLIISTLVYIHIEKGRTELLDDNIHSVIGNIVYVNKEQTNDANVTFEDGKTITFYGIYDTISTLDKNNTYTFNWKWQSDNEGLPIKCCSSIRTDNITLWKFSMPSYSLWPTGLVLFIVSCIVLSLFFIGYRKVIEENEKNNNSG